MHLVGQLVPFVFYANMIVLLVPSFAAIQGRSGSGSNPEYMMAIVVFVLGWLSVGLLVPVLCMVRRPVWWLAGVTLLWIVTIGVMFTPLGFPYHTQTAEQRFWIFVSVFICIYAVVFTLFKVVLKQFFWFYLVHKSDMKSVGRQHFILSPL